MRYDFDTVLDRHNTASLKWDSGRQDLLPMWVADMDLPVAPEIIQTMRERLEHPILGYSIQSDDYYNAVIGWFSSRYQFHIRREWICHAPGIVAGLHFIVQAATKPTDKVLVLTPSYYQFYKAAEDNGRACVRCPLRIENNRYVIDFALLEELAARDDVTLMLLCNPHNPGGRCWTREELKQVGDICLRHHVLLVSDEIHCDLTLGESRYTPLGTVGQEILENAIICVAPSKTFNLAGMQTSCLIIADERIRSLYMQRLVVNGIKRPNALGMVAMTAAYTKGAAWLEQCKAYLTENMRFMEAYLRENIPEFKLMDMEATYLAWIDVSGLGGKPGAYHGYLEEVGKLWLDGGAMFGPEGENFERLNFACSRQTLADALNRMKRAADAMREMV